jgi:uncharacterized protein (TIGR02246 family)
MSTTLPEIRALNRRMEAAVADTDVEAIGALYREDAIIQPPASDYVQGREAIKAVWARIFDAGLRGAVYETHSVLGTDLVVETGQGSLDFKSPDGESPKYRINYIVVHERQPDGSWQIVRDIWNEAPAE